MQRVGNWYWRKHMSINDPSQQTDHAHLIEALSAMMLQLNALQAIVRDGTANGVPDINAIRSGLTILEQMTREMLYELRSVSDDMALPELSSVTLGEALSRAVEEKAESLGLSSRIVFSGEERPLRDDIERLLYRIAQEALEQVQHHTNARKLRFALNYGRDEAQVSIEDDGVAPGQGDLSISTGNQVPAPPFTPADVDTRFTAPGDLFALLRKRTEHLGGSLEINTSVEQGTQVLARIPYVYHTHTETKMPPAAPDAVGNARVRVLIADAQAVTRAGLRRLLESYPDLEVVGEATDGVQAVSETLELGPQVVILDAQLPNGQSLETLRAGAGGYVLKDIAADELAQAVRTVARGEVLVQPQIAGRLISRFGQQARGNYGHEALTAREQEVLRLLARGLRNKEIAARLFVSERTVNFHLANIYQKLNVSGRTEALSKALEKGLITA